MHACACGNGCCPSFETNEIVSYSQGCASCAMRLCVCENRDGCMGSYKRVNGRSQTIEKPKAIHPQMMAAWVRYDCVLIRSSTLWLLLSCFSNFFTMDSGQPYVRTEDRLTPQLLPRAIICMIFGCSSHADGFMCLLWCSSEHSLCNIYSPPSEGIPQRSTKEPGFGSPPVRTATNSYKPSVDKQAIGKKTYKPDT